MNGDHISEILQTPSAKSELCPKSQTESGKSIKAAFSLSWSQYVFLIGIKDDDARSFYEIEAANNNWTLPELTRQFNSGLYERLALSRDKAGVRKLAKEGQVISRQEDLLKEPKFLFYRVLSIDFINLINNSSYGVKMPRANWDYISNCMS